MSIPENTTQLPATTGAFGEAAGNDVLTHSFADVPDYKTADPQVKALIDARIAKINPHDLNSITTHGAESSEKLGSSSRDIIAKIQSANSFVASLADTRTLLKNFDFESVGKIAAQYTQTASRALQRAELSIRKNPVVYIGAAISAVIAGIPLAAAIIVGGLGAKGLAKKWRGPTIEDMSYEIDKSLLQLDEVVGGLKEARQRIPGLVEDLTSLEEMRIEAYHDFALDVSAAVEVYRRLKEEVVPQLEREAQDSPAKLRDLREMRTAMLVLNRKATDMDAFHKVSLAQLKSIDDLQQALAISQLNIDSHLSVSKGQWEALVAESSVATSVADVVQADADANEFGKKIFEQSQTMTGMVRALARESFKNGSIDPQVVIDHLQRQTREMVEDLSFAEEFNANMELRRMALEEAAKEHRAAALKVMQPVKPEELLLLEDQSGGEIQAPSPVSKDKPALRA